MVFQIVCAWCGYLIGTKECEFHGSVEEAVTHTICPTCAGKVLASIDATIEKAGVEEKSFNALRRP